MIPKGDLQYLHVCLLLWPINDTLDSSLACVSSSPSSALTSFAHLSRLILPLPHRLKRLQRIVELIPLRY